MKRFLFVIVALVFSGVAAAETLSWEPPTSRNDGTPLDPVAELAPYELVCGDVVTQIPPTNDGPQEYEVTKHEILPAYGTTDCYMVAVDLDGLRSEPSNSVPISWEKASPARPTNLLIIIE